MKHQTSNGDTEKRVIDTSTTKYTYPTSIEKKLKIGKKPIENILLEFHDCQCDWDREIVLEEDSECATNQSKKTLVNFWVDWRFKFCQLQWEI